MKIKINSLYIVTSRNEEPAMYDNLEEALQDGVERQQDPSDKPLEIGDYGSEDMINAMLGYLEHNESQEVMVEKLSDYLNRLNDY